MLNKRKVYETEYDLSSIESPYKDTNMLNEFKNLSPFMQYFIGIVFFIVLFVLTAPWLLALVDIYWTWAFNHGGFFNKTVPKLSK